ncbi:MAG: hypothetical protein GY730_02550 [bacterium]|nr:hypothetical protein [bacterium]
MHKMGAEKVFSIREKNTTHLQSVYERVGLIKDILADVYFPAYGKKVNGAFEPIVWEIYSFDKDWLEILKKLVDYINRL